MLLDLIALVPAFAFHEWAHARVAVSLGDPTPRWHGRLTLNPLKHIDLIGLIFLFYFKFGWAKPVPVNPGYFDNPRRGMLLVALAGPASNIVMAYAGLAAQPLLGPPHPYLVYLFRMFVIININLAVFNLIPIPPLDGSKILAGLLPPRQSYALRQMEPYGWLLLLLLLSSGMVGAIMGPGVRLVYGALRALATWASGVAPAL